MIRKWIPLLILTLIYSCVTGQNFFWSHAGVTVETNTLKDSVLAVWELDETAGTTVYDSYDSNDGTNTSTTINQTGIIDKAYDFNGTSSYLSLPPEHFRFNPLAESYSVSMWVKSADPSPTTSAPYLVSGGRSGAGISYSFMWFIVPGSSDELQMAVKNHENTQILATIDGSNIWDNTWHLVTMTVNHSDGYVRSYLDGAIQDSASITFETYTVDESSVFFVSKAPFAFSRFYDGLADQFSVWGRALTGEDLSDLYNSGNGIAYTGWQGTGAQRYNSSSTWSITPLFTKTLNFTPDATWYAGSHSFGSNIVEDDKYIFIVFNKDNYLNHVVYRINKSTGDTLSQVIQADNAYYNDYHKQAALLVTDGCLLVAIEQLPGNNNHNGPVEIFRWTDTDSLQNYTSTVIGNTRTERLSYPFLYEAGDSVVIETRRYEASMNAQWRVYYTSADTGQTFSSVNSYLTYGDSDYWIYTGQVGNNSRTNPILGITPAWVNPVQVYQYITFLKSDFTGDFYSLGGDNLGTLVSSVELKDNYTWGDTDKNTTLKYARYSKVFGSYIYGLGLSGTRTSVTTDVDSMQIFKVNTSTGVASNGDAFATTQSSTAIEYSIIFAYDGDMYVKFGEGGSIYYYRVKSDLSGMDLVLTESGNYHMGFLTDMYSELSADYNPTTKVLRIYRFDDPDGL